MVRVRGGDFDLIVVSLGLRGFDGLRLCSQLRSLPEGRNVPILVVVSDGDRRKLTQALEMGVNDYLTRPVDKNELIARVRTQLRKKRYADRLRHNVQLSLEMAITDQLTGLHNRRYMSRHLDTLIASAHKSGKPIAFLIMDIDLLQVGQRHLRPRHRRRSAARIRRPHFRQCARHRSGLPLWRRGIRGGDARYRHGLRLYGGRAPAQERRSQRRSPSAAIRASSTSPSASASPVRKAMTTPPMRCCTAPTRRSIAPSARAATASSPTRPKTFRLSGCAIRSFRIARTASGAVAVQPNRFAPHRIDP